MLMPWHNFDEIANKFLKIHTNIAVLGCLSFETRCRFIPDAVNRLLNSKLNGTIMLEIIDPKGCTPDYSDEAESRRNENAKILKNSGVYFERPSVELLSNEDELVDIYNDIKSNYKSCDTLVFDISSFPKRFFCFFLKRFLNHSFPNNLIITYTQPNKYPPANIPLAEDLQAISYLPGFSGTENLKKKTIAISIGFERFNLSSILEQHSENKEVKILMSFPPNGDYLKRQWKVLREIFEDSNDLTNKIEVVSALDCELVYLTLEKWHHDSEDFVLVPFGPKPHSLGMSIFATKYNYGIYYSQPKSYNPNYTEGIGNSWAYVAKWEGVPCFKRFVRPL